jgi:hypothetical protein
MSAHFKAEKTKGRPTRRQAIPASSETTKAAIPEMIGPSETKSPRMKVAMRLKTKSYVDGSLPIMEACIGHCISGISAGEGDLYFPGKLQEFEIRHVFWTYRPKGLRLVFSAARTSLSKRCCAR